MYFSTGASLADVYYPPGASVNMTLFGKRAKFDCTLGKMIKIMATIEQFLLGPLTVRDTTQRDPIVAVEFSSDTQRILTNGVVDIWEALADLFFDASLLPETTFRFFVQLKLGDLFLLRLEAQLLRGINIHNYKTLANANLKMKGPMQQKLLDHIATQLDQ